MLLYDNLMRILIQISGCKLFCCRSIFRMVLDFVSNVFRRKTGSYLLNCLKIIKELTCQNPYYSIGRNPEYHSGYSGSKSGCQYYNKDLKRMSLNTVGKYNWLKYNIINYKCFKWYGR